MGDFLDPDDVPAAVRGDATEDDIDLQIDLAEGAIRAYCGWHISAETGATHTVDGPCGPALFLPTLALTAVTSVVENGLTLAVSTDYRWLSSGVVTRYGSSRWYDGFQSVTVTFNHGYADDSPEWLAVKQVVLAVVARQLSTPNERQTGYNVGGIGETWAAPPQVPSGLLYSEQGSLAPFKLLAVA